MCVVGRECISASVRAKTERKCVHDFGVCVFVYSMRVCIKVRLRAHC